MNIQDILHTIHGMGRDDAERVLEAARMRREYLAKAAINVGSKVKFDAGKRGVVVGEVIKINPTRTKVRTTTGMTWNVSHSLLEEA